jgi:hypothetical protein
MEVLDATRNVVVWQSSIVGGQPQEVWIHRKGAAPSDQGFMQAGVIEVVFFRHLGTVESVVAWQLRDDLCPALQSFPCRSINSSLDRSMIGSVHDPPN